MHSEPCTVQVMEKHLQEQHSVSRSLSLVGGLCKLDGAKLELVINIVYNLNSSDTDKVEDDNEKVEAIDSDWIETRDNYGEDGAKLEPKCEIETDSEEEEYKSKKTVKQAIKTKKPNPKTTKIENGECIQYKCDQCGKIARDKHRLKDHMKIHSDEREFACEQCTKRFKGIRALREHIKAHDGIFDKECPDCDMKFVSSTALQSHIIRKHTPGYSFSCDQCGKEFRMKGQLKNHMTLHTGEKPYKCREGCDTTFRTASIRKDHERQHLEAGEDIQYKCDQCGKIVKDKHKLKDHMKIHSNKKEFACEQCSKRFKGSRALKEHIKAHDGIFDKECPDCDMKFVASSSLNAHIRRKHTSGYGFSCDQCTKEFKTKGQLGQHMTLHTGEKPLKCREGCDKTFRTSNSRKCHERQHLGVKEFGCTYCSKMFMQPHQLKDHIKRHEGTKDHVCEVCGKAFIESAQARKCKHNQTSHSRIHSIVQPTPFQEEDSVHLQPPTVF